jgi:predicted ATPase
MIKSIKFKNYKALRDAVLPLGRFNLIVGPNNIGKSTALEAIRMAGNPHLLSFERSLSIEVDHLPEATIEMEISWDEEEFGQTMVIKWKGGSQSGRPISEEKIFGYEGPEVDAARRDIREKLRRVQIFSFSPRSIAKPTKVMRHTELKDDGSDLAGVLDLLHSKDPEKFDTLTQELTRWLPDFDRILFDYTSEGE